MKGKRKMSRYYDRMYKIRKRITQDISYVFRVVRETEATHEDLCKRIKHKVWDNPDLAKLPRYSRSYIDGYSTCKHQDLYGTMLFCHIWKGVPVTTEEWKALFPDGNYPWPEFSDEEKTPRGTFWPESRKRFF